MGSLDHGDKTLQYISGWVMLFLETMDFRKSLLQRILVEAKSTRWTPDLKHDQRPPAQKKDSLPHTERHAGYTQEASCLSSQEYPHGIHLFSSQPLISPEGFQILNKMIFYIKKIKENEKVSYRLGENICKSSDKRLVSWIYKRHNSIITWKLNLKWSKD